MKGDGARTVKEPATGQKLTDEQLEAIAAWTEHNAKERHKALGSEYHESDYLAGVMTTLFALGCEDRIPVGWIIGPMFGRPVFEEAGA
jgi:hypothetical protein